MLSSERRERERKLLWFLVGASLLAHGVALVLFLALASHKPPPLKLDENVVKARLVKLGKKRDEKLLPRIDKGRPPPPPKKEAPRPEAEPELPKPKEPKPEPRPEEPRPSAAEVLDRFREEHDKPDLKSLIQKAVGEPTDEGHEEGSKLGEDITGRLKADYNDKVLAHIKSYYQLPPTLSDEERVRLKALLFVRIGANGELLDAHIAKPSGNATFDSAVLSAARKAAPLPPPPIPLRDFYAKGVAMRMCPVSCS